MKDGLEHIGSILKGILQQIQKAYEDQQTEMVDREKVDYAGSQNDAQEIIP